MCVVDADLKFAMIAAMECEVGPRGGVVVGATVFAVVIVGATGRPPYRMYTCLSPHFI